MTVSEGNTTSSLTQKTVKGFFWAYASFLGGKGLNFLTTIILARLQETLVVEREGESLG